MCASIKQAVIHWDKKGTPISDYFDDVYFSSQNGYEETRYVFLTQNNLPARFESHASSHFVIAETGFGTGLNFLATWQLFEQFLKKHPKACLQALHFISFEKYPLTLSDLKKVQAAWPSLAPFSDALCAQYPSTKHSFTAPGLHSLFFAKGKVRLDLWFGDINHTLKALYKKRLTEKEDKRKSDKNEQGLIDCWYLDGFTPSKNPSMWTQPLFDHMAMLANIDCQLATFTSAGFVRRGLISAGFSIEKVPGFGYKREMLRGKLKDKPPINQNLR